MVPRFPLHFIVLLKTFVRGGPFNTLLLNPVQELSHEEGDGGGGGGGWGWVLDTYHYSSHAGYMYMHHMFCIPQARPTFEENLATLKTITH